MRCDAIGQTILYSLQMVSIHTPTWGVTTRSTTSTVPVSFQSTHLHEVWPFWIFAISDTKSFNPHTYMRCDVRSARMLEFIVVSIHTPTCGVTIPRSNTRADGWSFNPHTYMRCDRSPKNNRCNWLVSIHTPTWGVTRNHICQKDAKSVSIHTPTWGVTTDTNTMEDMSTFQSTHLHEVWRWLHNNRTGIGMFQSTHLHEVWQKDLSMYICI